MDNKIFGLVRVSTKDQNPERQVIAIKEYCKENNLIINERDILIDKQSGKNFERPGYIMLRDNLLRKGDILIIKELDRLGRNMSMIKEEWQKLINIGINIIIIDSPILNTTNKTDIERILISNIVFELLAYMGEKNRLKIRQAQKEGIEAAKARGQHLGRPKIQFPSNWENWYLKWKNKEITGVEAMKQMGLKKNSFYNLVKRYEEKSI